MTTAKTGAVFEDFSPEVSKDFTSDAATFKLGLLIDFRFTGNVFETWNWFQNTDTGSQFFFKVAALFLTTAVVGSH